MLKLGIVGLDGHGPVFANVVNGPEPKVEGARVVAAMPVPSVMIPEERLRENIEKTRALGIEILDDPKALASRVDGVLVLHDDGSKHQELASLFAPFGKPIFVDKPFETTPEKARALVEACRRHSTPVFSASSLRFSKELTEALADNAGGEILSAMTYSPFSPKPTMPGWIYYAVHSVEPLFQILGRGCERLSCLPGEHGPVAIGEWSGGRTGIAKATARGHWSYGFTLWREKADQMAVVDPAHIYPALLREVKAFIETGKSPVDPEQSVEMVAFMAAANESMANGGKPVALKC
ncbi:MAG TPA: Gfo/Idh/MocA family oxidoreductase [Armatimonadetes bacterium]|jgi:hypothetical protein|nr:Gfo/Idh/MocA family oxidoreductase [Armatimonadota bacterium]